MRASLYLIGFAAASIVGAGIVEIGCSSSSSPAPAGGGDDASTTDSATPPEDTGTPAADTGTTPCTPLSDASAATIVTGSPSWDCYEAMCMPSLTACAADCKCNNDILTALNCVAMDAGSTTTCFGPVSSAGTPTDTAVLTCLLANSACMTAGGEGGTDGGSPEAATSEAGADAGDGG